jgi:HAMP domain-containing protein
MFSEQKIAEPWPPALAVLALLAVLLGATVFSINPAVGLLFVLAFTLGALVSGLTLWLWLYRPLLRVRAGCRRISSGDLSHTLPEDGPTAVAEMARFNNSLAADFQEILLLFAHLARSAMSSARLLQEHVVDRLGTDDRGRASEIIEDIHQMQEVIEEFKYFRVCFEDGRIIDTGLVVSTTTQRPSTQKPQPDLELRSAVLEGEKK